MLLKAVLNMPLVPSDAICSLSFSLSFSLSLSLLPKTDRIGIVQSMDRLYTWVQFGVRFRIQFQVQFAFKPNRDPIFRPSPITITRLSTHFGNNKENKDLFSTFSSRSYSESYM
jgi:hypothetical protein